MNSAQNSCIYEFEGFVLDPLQRVVRAQADGQTLRLTARAFDALHLLVEHHGQLVDKDTLIKTLWPKVVVEENNLTQIIHSLRQTLGEKPGEHRFIATAPGRGYQFVAVVTAMPRVQNGSGPSLNGISNGEMNLAMASVPNEPGEAIHPAPGPDLEAGADVIHQRVRNAGGSHPVLDTDKEAAEDNNPPRRRRMHWNSWTAFVVIVVGIVLAAGSFILSSTRQPAELNVPRISRFTIPASLTTGWSAARRLAISPDGSRLAYVTEGGGFFTRSLEHIESVEIRENGFAPFFSPDGQWLAYTDGQSLKKIPAGGGTPVQMMDSGPAAIGNWSSAGIVFAGMNGLFRVAPDGHSAQKLNVGLGPNEQAMFPQLLPDNRTLLYTVFPARANTVNYIYKASRARVDMLDLATGTHATLILNGGRAQYLPTGHLVYVAGGNLYAVAFDLKYLELRGKPVAMVSQLGMNEYAVANNGTLAYYIGSGPPIRVLVWVDRQGQEEPIEAPPAEYIYPRLSPDGTRIAIDVNDVHDRNIWIWDLRRKTFERFTMDPASNPVLAWSRDGRSLVFGSDRSGVSNLFMQTADGSGAEQHLLKSDRIQQPISFAPDGRLLFSADIAGHGRDIYALAMDGSGRAEPIVYSDANDGTAEVSPDGRWIAYDSEESGQFEVYVRPYPKPYGGQRWQVSTGGGHHPLWSRDGRELYYRNFDGALCAVSVTLNPTFEIGPIVKLFSNPNYLGKGRTLSGRSYDLSLDGRRFLMEKVLPQPIEPSAQKIVVVLNWFEELKRAVPSDGSTAAD